MCSSQVELEVKNPPASAGDLREIGSILGLGRSPGGGHGKPLWCSCLENPIDKKNLVVHGVTQNQTPLKRLNVMCS